MDVWMDKNKYNIWLVLGVSATAIIIVVLLLYSPEKERIVGKAIGDSFCKITAQHNPDICELRIKILEPNHASSPLDQCVEVYRGVPMVYFTDFHVTDDGEESPSTSLTSMDLEGKTAVH